MQSIKPDILPIFVSFRRDTALQQSQQKLPGRSCKSARVAAMSTTFSSARSTGPACRGTVFETDGERGVVKSEKLSISVFVIPPSCQSIPHSPNNHKRQSPSPQSPWQNPYPDAVAHTTYARVRRLIFKLVFMFIPPALTYSQHAHLEACSPLA